MDIENNKGLETPLIEREDSEQKEVGSHSAISVAESTRKTSDGDVVDDSRTTVIDGKCNLVNGTYFCGFLAGVVIQSLSLYAVGIILPASSGETKAAAAAAAHIQTTPDTSISLVFALYFFTRYWVLVALLLPPFVTSMIQKYRCCRRNTTMKGNLESYFECVRFQLGVFFGSLILLSLFNFYTLAKSAPLYLLLGYYAICVVVSFFALCLLQIFVNQVCANVSSVEIIVSFEKEDKDGEVCE